MTIYHADMVTGLLPTLWPKKNWRLEQLRSKNLRVHAVL